MKTSAYIILILAIVVAFVGVVVALTFAIPAAEGAEPLSNDCPPGSTLYGDSGLGCYRVVGLGLNSTLERPDRQALAFTAAAGSLSHWTATKVSVDTETKPSVCEALDGSGDLEPCAWQDAAKEAAERAVREARDKAACRAMGCRVHRQSCADLCQHGACLSLGCDPSVTWHCDCAWKPAKKSGAR